MSYQNSNTSVRITDKEVLYLIHGAPTMLFASRLRPVLLLR